MDQDTAPDSELKLDRSLLNTLFRFKPNSMLKRFLTMITGQEKNIYALAEVLTILKNTLRRESMFDVNNPSVILCSRQLEEAFNMKAFHVTEVRDLVLMQLEEVPEQDQLNVPQVSVHSESSGFASLVISTDGGECLMRDVSLSGSIYANNHVRFTLKPAFMEVIKTVLSPGAELKTLFSYEEISLLLSRYILSKKNSLFDPRNIKLAMVHDDPLGIAFGVQAFHRCQVNNLLKKQLIPVDADPTGGDFDGNGGNPSVSSHAQMTASTSTLPALPSTSRALSNPSSLFDSPSRVGQLLKRSSSGEREFKSKLVRGTSECRVIVCSPYNSDTDADSVQSVKYFETIKMEDERDSDRYYECFGSMVKLQNNDDKDLLDSDLEDRSSQIYAGEYDVESGEEEERPELAHGIGKDFSSADDTETDIDEDVKIVVVPNIDDMYWADDEYEYEVVDAIRARVNNSKCISCGITNDTMLYCGKCWKARGSWVERPKLRRRSKECDTNKNMTVSVASDKGGGLVVAEADDRLNIDSEFESQEFDISNLQKVLESTTSSQVSSLLCEFCCLRPRNASLIHGLLAHQICCYPCAKRLWKKQARCPVCRRKVERIVKNIQA